MLNQLKTSQNLQTERNLLLKIRNSNNIKLKLPIFNKNNKNKSPNKSPRENSYDPKSEYQTLLQEYETLKQKNEKKFKEKILEKSRKLADNLLDIGLPQYEEIIEVPEGKEGNQHENVTKLLYSKNIERVVKVRDIMKRRKEVADDILDYEDLKTFKQKIKLEQNNIVKIMQRIGAPNYLKTKFKMGTILKYNNLSGAC